MTNELKRILLFLFGCIGTRLFLVYLAKTVSIQYLPVLGYAALLVAIGLMYFFITGARKTGFEVFGDKIWWNNLRPVHATLYALFAYYAIQKSPNAWMFLLADVILGLVAFVRHHAF